MTGFWWLPRAEWTKFRTVRGWVMAMAAAALLVVLIGMWAGSAGQDVCGGGGAAVCRPDVPRGPGGEAVTDDFYLVGQPLTGNGSITARVTSLAGVVGSDQLGGPVTAGLAPWSKAGIIITAGTRPGSAYAAVMVTGGHGVRMQDDYTGDTAGLPAVAQAGLFVTSPDQVSATGGAPTAATAVSDHVSPPGPRGGGQIGAGDIAYPALPGRFRQAGGRFTVTGSGDIAPALPGPADGYVSPDHSLAGVFAALVVVAVTGTMFLTAEYRRGLIRVTLAASPGRGPVLAAKAIVIGSVSFAAGLAGAAAAVPVGDRLRGTAPGRSPPSSR